MPSNDDVREHYKKEIEYILETSDESGEVRVSYADGHSEIKPAKVLLLDDIMHFVDAYVTASNRELLEKLPPDFEELGGKTDYGKGYMRALNECRAVIKGEKIDE